MVPAMLLYVFVQTANGVAVAADPQTIVEASKCYQCIVNDGMFLPTLLYVIAQTAEGVPVSTDPDTLQNSARCFGCTIPTGMTPAALLEESVRLNQSVT